MYDGKEGRTWENWVLEISVRELEMVCRVGREEMRFSRGMGVSLRV